MQANSRWTAPRGVLGRLTAAANERASLLDTRHDVLIAAARALPPPPSLASALRGPAVSVIAELKRGSPSKGMIAPGLDAPLRAREYVRGGAAALSILTEEESFGGSNADLVGARASVSVPLLRKDFHMRPVQLAEARALGASAALLIVRAIAPAALAEMVLTAAELDLEVVLEVRDEVELERALELGCRLIGVNNRNLETLEVDRDTAARLIPLIPADRIAIFESGIRNVADVREAAATGTDAMLVGSTLSLADDGERAVRELCGVARVDRGA